MPSLVLSAGLVAISPGRPRPPLCHSPCALQRRHPRCAPPRPPAVDPAVLETVGGRSHPQILLQQGDRDRDFEENFESKM